MLMFYENYTLYNIIWDCETLMDFLLLALFIIYYYLYLLYYNLNNILEKIKISLVTTTAKPTKNPYTHK